MGYIRHDAIVVTGWNLLRVEAAISNAKALGLPVSNPVEGLINEEWSFLIAPDGSKEGWDTSEKADEARNEFKKWLIDSQAPWLHFAHVSFGGDEPQLAYLVDFNGKE